MAEQVLPAGCLMLGHQNPMVKHSLSDSHAAYPHSTALALQRAGLRVLAWSRCDKSPCCMGAAQQQAEDALGLMCPVSAYVSQLLSS